MEVHVKYINYIGLNIPAAEFSLENFNQVKGDCNGTKRGLKQRRMPPMTTAGKPSLAEMQLFWKVRQLDTEILQLFSECQGKGLTLVQL